jgi:predicted nucleic acid-binding protein
MRVVLDANVFVSAAITAHGACGKILKAVLGNPDEFELILTEQIIIETNFFK